VAYDPDDAARVSARIRGEATLEQAVDQWEQVYADVLAEGDVAVDPDAALSAASRYLRSLAEVVKDRTIADVRASQLTHEWATAESGRSAALDGLARTGAELARTQEELGLVIDGLEAEIAAQRDRQTTLEASRAWRISTSLWRANARIRNPRGPR
jgi:hypothetical protein